MELVNCKLKKYLRVCFAFVVSSRKILSTTPSTLLVRSAHPGGLLVYEPKKLPHSSQIPIKVPYNKPVLELRDQLQQLKDRGMHVSNDEIAIHYLGHLNYYRLAAYWLPFEKDHATHQFRSGTTFEDVLNSYIFDRELRLLILDAIERIEVSVRTQLAHH